MFADRFDRFKKFLKQLASKDETDALQAIADLPGTLDEVLFFSKPPASYFTKKHTRGVVRTYGLWMGCLSKTQRKVASARCGKSWKH